MLNLAQGYSAQVTGIAQDPPANSHFHFTMLLSLPSYTNSETGDWITGRVFTYFKLKPRAAIENVSVMFDSIIEKKIGRELEQLRHTTLKNFKSHGNDLTFFYQPLLDVHLKSQLSDELEPNSNIQNLYTFFLLFTSLAIFIACLGLFGLATFTAEQRTKEIGIRKVVGASVNDVVLMLNQDFLKLVGISNLLAWPIAWWIMQSWLNGFAFRIPFPWWVLFVTGVVTLIISFLSVSFQARRAARGNPVKSLRDE